jgi:hypothetical protein
LAENDSFRHLLDSSKHRLSELHGKYLGIKEYRFLRERAPLVDTGGYIPAFNSVMSDLFEKIETLNYELNDLTFKGVVTQRADRYNHRNLLVLKIASHIRGA